MDTRTAHPSAELPGRHTCSITIVTVHPKYSGENVGTSGILEGSNNSKQVSIQHNVELDRGGRRDKWVRCIESVCELERTTMIKHTFPIAETV